eukprot:scaffold4868_cov416-Prasinococcus_capsulatus_cf.AAC.35
MVLGSIGTFKLGQNPSQTTRHQCRRNACASTRRAGVLLWVRVCLTIYTGSSAPAPTRGTPLAVRRTPVRSVRRGDWCRRTRAPARAAASALVPVPSSSIIDSSSATQFGVADQILTGGPQAPR